MQKIDRLLKIDRWEVLNEWVRQFTNVPVALILIVFAVLMALACGQQGLICISFLGPAYSTLTLIFELTACSSIIAYFVFRIRFINSLMENHLAPVKSPKPRKSFLTIAYTRYYAQETQNYYEASDTNIYLRELFKCFTMYQDLYRFQGRCGRKHEKC
ncbi:Gustatory receptor 45 [Operophtera brumata]|uniref:Gustatory receptor 45 n=1 Tax=Operophtera brumata TaxID=104452 RepID=A0A0L7KZW5_OPEBR|nr:Gustatory receptor 45 [Operophtera brumata]